MRVLRIAALLALALLPGAASDAPELYAIRIPVTPVAGARVQRLVLPAEAMASLQHADARDVRLFDSAGRALPMARAAVPAPADRRISLRPMPILGAADAVDVTRLSVRVDADGRARVARIDGTLRAEGSAVVGMLLDARLVRGTARRLIIDADRPEGQPVTFTVAASADLGQWRPVGEAVAYRAAGDGEPVTIPLNGGIDAEYLRIIWRAQSRLMSPVAIRSVTLITSADGPTPVALDAVLPVPADPRAIEAALPFATPLASITVTPAEEDMVVPVRILGRDDREQPWTLLGEGTAARVAGGAGGAIALAGRGYRAIRIEADPRTGGFVRTPAIRLGFEPAAILVLAGGAPPYTLAAGRADAPDVFLPGASLTGQVPPGAAIPTATARVAERRPLVLTAVADRAASRQIILWAILLGATAVLGAIAWRLWKRAPDEAPAA